MSKKRQILLVPSERVERAILVARGQKVLLDFDLAELYEVSTKVLNHAVRRNAARFPDDFMFRLTSDETESLNRSQIVTGSQKHRDPRYPPHAFTEQGVAMLSSVLKSERAVAVNIEIIEHSSSCERCWPRTPDWRSDSTLWRENTIPNSRSCSTPFANS